jgi:hypothetical protein
MVYSFFKDVPFVHLRFNILNVHVSLVNIEGTVHVNFSSPLKMSSPSIRVQRGVGFGTFCRPGSRVWIATALSGIKQIFLTKFKFVQVLGHWTS